MSCETLLLVPIFTNCMTLGNLLDLSRSSISQMRKWNSERFRKSWSSPKDFCDLSNNSGNSWKVAPQPKISFPVPLSLAGALGQAPVDGMSVTFRLSWLPSGCTFSVLYFPICRLNEGDSEGLGEGVAPSWTECESLNHHMEGYPIARSTEVRLLGDQEINNCYIVT